MKIEFFKNNELITKEFTKDKYSFVINSCLQIAKSKNDSVTWDKIWIYSDSGEIQNVIRTGKYPEIIDILPYTWDLNRFKNKFNLNLPSYPFYDLVCAAWIRRLYMNYGSLKNNGQKNSDDDLLNFLSIFDESDVENFLYELISDESTTEDETDEWIMDGMPLKDGSTPFTDKVIDCLFNIGFKPIEKQMIVTRNFSYLHDHGKNPKHKGWVSAAIFDEKIDSYFDCNERFVLPVGFPICRIPESCGSFIKEIVVRNEDLCQL